MHLYSDIFLMIRWELLMLGMLKMGIKKRLSQYPNDQYHITKIRDTFSAKSVDISIGLHVYCEHVNFFVLTNNFFV